MRRMAATTGVADKAICRTDSRRTMVVVVVAVDAAAPVANWHMVTIACHSRPMSEARPAPVLPRASGGPEPAAGRFKAGDQVLELLVFTQLGRDRFECPRQIVGN